MLREGIRIASSTRASCGHTMNVPSNSAVATSLTVVVLSHSHPPTPLYRAQRPTGQCDANPNRCQFPAATCSTNGATTGAGRVVEHGPSAHRTRRGRVPAPPAGAEDPMCRDPTFQTPRSDSASVSSQCRRDVPPFVPSWWAPRPANQTNRTVCRAIDESHYQRIQSDKKAS